MPEVRNSLEGRWWQASYFLWDSHSYSFISCPGEEETLVKSNRAMWSKLVVATTHKGFLWGKSSWPMAECGCWFVMDIFFIIIIDQGQLERRSESLFRRHCGCQSEYSLLGYCKKNRGGYFCINKLSCDSVVPKELAEFESFSISLKKLMFTNIFSERPERE